MTEIGGTSPTPDLFKLQYLTSKSKTELIERQLSSE